MNRHWQKGRGNDKRRGGQRGGRRGQKRIPGTGGGGEQRARQGGHGEQLAEGTIQHHGNFAFLISEKEGQGDVFLRGRTLDLAMDGDRVQARTFKERDGRLAGEIVKVLKRARNSIVGVLQVQGTVWVLKQEKGFAPPTRVDGFAAGIKPASGQLAALEIKRWPEEGRAASGVVTELIGDPGDLRARTTAIVRSLNIREAFPPEVLMEAASFGERLEPKHWKDREQLFGVPVVTIDGADAKDFDDAVSLEDIGGGKMRLGVHIADVANYVRTGTALDAEAYARATSVYLPGRVIPMLPHALSDNLCSLVPDQERLTLSVFMDVDQSGSVVKRRMAETVIKSCRRLTYEEAQEILEGKKIPAISQAACAAVRKMGALAARLYARRIKRGALDFDLPEYKVETDERGLPVKVERRPRLQSHRLVEEFMLLANESIAMELNQAKSPFLHRRHDDPDPAKLLALSQTLGDLGLSAGHIRGSNARRGLQDILAKTGTHPLSATINSLIVRSMRQAVYSPESKGHFGIAARYYAHFTSPIRRYPDLMAHRAVKALLHGMKPKPGHIVRAFNAIFPGKKEAAQVPLIKAGEHCSERERAATEAERKVSDLMKAELLRTMVGQVMDGVVTAAAGSGAFVSLAESGADGLLRGATWLKPGDRVRVKIESINPIDGKIDLSAADQPGLPPHWAVKKRQGRRR
ncbi:MAG: VacB/RNase II family 3'-5' exoribonuclease [Elusimicrobiota bacterium]